MVHPISLGPASTSRRRRRRRRPELDVPCFSKRLGQSGDSRVSQLPRTLDIGFQKTQVRKASAPCPARLSRGCVGSTHARGLQQKRTIYTLGSFTLQRSANYCMLCNLDLPFFGSKAWSLSDLAVKQHSTFSECSSQKVVKHTGALPCPARCHGLASSA